MKIILILSGMLLTCGLSGALLIYALRANGNFKKLAMHIGYAYTSIAFYLLYMQFHSVVTATALTVALPLFLAALTMLARGLKLWPATGAAVHPPGGAVADARGELAYVVAASAVVVLLAAWPYLLLGWGSYWHSGNFDVEDDLNGRDAYVNNLIFDTRPVTMGTLSSNTTWYDFLKATGALPKKAQTAETYRDWYAGDELRLHYSSLAFWSTLIDENHGLDAFMMEALLYLVLMAVGIFHLSRQAFSLTPMASALAAAISVCNVFYLTTFVAGHGGSLMYGALIPALLYLALTKGDAGRAVAHKFIFGGMIVGTIAFSYPHPIAIIAAPLLAHWLFSIESFRNRVAGALSAIRKNPRVLYPAIIVSVIALGVMGLGLWHVTEGYRLKQYDEYRAWGHTHDWLIVPLFLGLIPSPGGGFHLIVTILGKSSYFALVMVSCLMAGVLCVLYFKARPPKNSRFFLIFGLFWIVEFFVFKYFIVDSYYLYKFLYTHQFIFVIGVAAYVYRAKSRLIKSLCVVIVLANLASDFIWGYWIYHRPYNQNTERYASLLQVDRAILQKSFIDLVRSDAIPVRQTLKAHGATIQRDPRLADYFIVPSGYESDITNSQFTETIAEAGGLAFKRAPAKNYLLIRTKWSEPELFPADPVLKTTAFQWIGHGKDDNLGVYVVRPSPVEEMTGRYLRVCLQKGPSADRDLNITVSSEDKEVLSRFVLGSGVHCEWIPAERVISAAQPILIRSGARGKSLLPYDDRILLYRIFAVGWSDRVYDDMALPFFSATPDIVKNGSRKAEGGVAPGASLHLGQGWEAYESFDGKTFRWAGRSTEIVLTGGDKDGVANVALNLEPGPSHGAGPLELEVLDKDGDLVFTSAKITGRNTVTLPLSYHKQRTSVYKLKTKSPNLPVPGDPRILNYRVFSVALQ